MGNPNILRLTIKREYFLLILSGQKTEEYRDRKPYYDNKFQKKYTHIFFVNGYNKNSPTILKELLKIEKTKTRYILYLGETISTSNLKS